METKTTIKEKNTLKDLLLKYEFDTLVPDLILTDKPVKDNLYAFKEAFDELRRMEPRDPHGEQIVVDIEVDTDDDGNEIERYLHASNCEGDYWEASLAKEVIIKADVTELRALAQILWHMTFYGFTAEEKTMWDDVPHNHHLIDRLLLYACDFDFANVKYLNETTAITLYEFYSRTKTAEGRVDYILDNMKVYFNVDCLREFTRLTVVTECPEQYPFKQDEFIPLANYIRAITSFAESPCRFYVGKSPWSTHDIHIIIIASR